MNGHQKQAISAQENIWKGLESEMSKYRNTPCDDLSMSLTTATTAYTLPKKKGRTRGEFTSTTFCNIDAN